MRVSWLSVCLCAAAQRRFLAARDHGAGTATAARAITSTAARQPSRPSANRSDSNRSHFHNRADDSAAIDRACHGDAVLMKTKHTVNEDEQP